MSSGSILLQQLRSRQSKSSCCGQQAKNNSASSSDGNNHNDENTDVITSCEGATVAAPTNTSEVTISRHRTSVSNTATKKRVIEVCLGPDCAVAGGGAALLEIEDLVLQQCQDSQRNKEIVVQAGGCRDQCTEGPNVRILSCNIGGEMDDDFHKVNSPEACRRVVSSLCQRENTRTKSNVECHAGERIPNTNTRGDVEDSSSSDDIVARLMQRKEDAKRWKAHRERASKERRLQAILRNQGMLL